jgi:tRNA-2-methylthio-N6-dimethylallyladenosine synthase
MAKKYLIETFGCQMNVHDSERMAGLLDQAGYESTNDEVEADLIVINTCSVREHAEEKLYTRLGEIRLLGELTSRPPLVAVAGCVAQQEGSRLLRKTNGHLIDVVVGTQRQKMLPMLVDRASREGRSEVEIDPWSDVTFPLGLARRGDPVKAYVTIIEGCNDHCAFCVVPNTRGHERMRAKQDILREVAEAVESGRREIHLLGQIVNHYQAPDDPHCDFPRLLAEVHEVPGVWRIRFASPHPRHTGARLVDAIRDLPRVCRHLHLPVQSGSSRVLQAMRRRHSREDYLRLLDDIRRAVPDITLSTDMIVGFPGETLEDFEQTLSLTRAAQYHSMFSFKYSPRPKTLAAARLSDDVGDGEKTDRIVSLQALQREIQTTLHQRAVGTVVEVLVDSISRRRPGELSGRTCGNTVVNFALPPDVAATHGVADCWLGRLVHVAVRRAGPHSVSGDFVSGADSGGPHAH